METEDFVLSIHADASFDDGASQSKEARLPLAVGELASLSFDEAALHVEILSCADTELLLCVQTTRRHTLVYNGKQGVLPICEQGKPLFFSFGDDKEKITATVRLLRM